MNGRWPAMGFHTRGEMGGIWTPPLKLLDGLWFSVDGRPIGAATRFTSGWGYIEMDLPDTAGLQARRVEFAPDGRRAVLIGLRLSATGAGRTVEVGVDAHSELMSAYPWGDSTTSSSLQQADTDASRTAARFPSRAADGRVWWAGQCRPAAKTCRLRDQRASVVGRHDR